MSVKNFKKLRLKNGMVVMHEARELPVVAVSITNRFGASFEESKIKGIAHFIEHLVFTGTKTRTHEDISREIEKKGGILNAFTSHDMTSFWFKLPSQHLFAGLEILSDILNNPVFEKEKFEKEKKVVIEEIKMYHDAPQRDINDRIETNLYDKPFGDNVIGSAATLNGLSRDFVFDYFKKVYDPGNFIVTIVGKADLKRVCAFLEKSFVQKKISIFPKKIILLNNETKEEREGIDQAHFMLAMHAPLLTESSHAVLEVLDAYLANGMSSRLFLTIREERGLAYAVKSSISTEKNYSYYAIYVGTTKPAIAQVKSLILEGFKNVEKMTEKDIKESKERIVGLQKVSTEESVNVMNELMMHELIDKGENYYTQEKKIFGVSLKDVKSLAKSMIKKYSTAAIVPK